MTTQTFTPGTRVRHTNAYMRTGTVEPGAVAETTRNANPGLVPVQWDNDDAWLTHPDYLEVLPAHRPAVAPVPDVVFAENGATAIAPPPQARRGFSQAGLASVIQPDVAAGLHRAHTAEAAARALAAYVRAV